ncbi:S8 family serine peptidase [Micromonospora musae]|uniref:S8 family serine peptidase n=1 Tax=Micromonospora musae TaxID=1894970 RepID=UPI0033EA29CD
MHSYVDVAAPGVDIWGADIGSKGRVSAQGSSQSGALTAGVAALILAKYPKLAPGRSATCSSAPRRIRSGTTRRPATGSSTRPRRCAPPERSSQRRTCCR